MTRALLLLFALLGPAACGTKAQSFREGVEIICSAGDEPSLAHANPADRQARMSDWIEARLRNAEARTLFAAIADASPDVRQSLLGDAAKRAGLDRCALVDAVPVASAPRDVPDARDGKLDPLPPGSTVVLGAGVTGAAVAEAIAAQPPGAMLLAPTPSTAYELLGAAIASARAAHPDVVIVANGPDGPGGIPLTFVSTGPAPTDLGLIIAVTRDEIMVFSTSGRAGTIMAPQWRGPLTAREELRAALAAIPTPGDRRVTVMADNALTAADVVPVMAIARHSFPDIIFPVGLP
jgi:hypothetical protein